MKNMLLSLVSSLALLWLSSKPCTAGQRRTVAPVDSAEWTIMIYMDGDNNLETNAILNFLDMARVGSTNKVNIIVQFDRCVDYDTTYGNWTQTLRYRIRPGMPPTVRAALQDIGEANMGDGETLKNFTVWAMKKYPAKHYMLDIWDHGQGWRARASGHRQVAPLGDFRSTNLSPVKSCSYDESSGDELYNRKITDALGPVFAIHKLDLIGFDCCLMSMLETAYGLRNIAKVMVGSEELEPGTGWQYNFWLRDLVAHPDMSPTDLGKLLVKTYKERYDTTPNDSTTMAAIDLEAIPNAANQINQLSGLLIQQLAVDPGAIKASRDSCRYFAPNPYFKDPPVDYFFHIDLTRFCDILASLSTNPRLAAAARSASSAIGACIIDNYRGVRRGGAFGSNGLAIYFPATASDYHDDVFAERGYERINPNDSLTTKYPVEFVQANDWTLFLHAYYTQFH